uniref:Uncharacterized protein n=1 Tax=Sinocyclocheilus grahami TaxID=75366 RepID=A0A672RFB9_SINGR
MGKRQHQKDKMYITCTEYTQFYGGKKSETILHLRFMQYVYFIKSSEVSCHVRGNKHIADCKT